MQDLASVGLTTREACGDTVRNVQGCHLAGACPFEVLDISAWAEAAYRHFVRHPLAQRLPASSRSTSPAAPPTAARPCSTTSASSPPRDRRGRHGRARLPGLRGRRPRRQPPPGPGPRGVHPREDLLPTLEAILRVFNNHGNRDNKLRARLKWLVDTMGWDELQARILKERKFLLASSSWPGGIPEIVEKLGDAPAGWRRRRHAHAHGPGHAGHHPVPTLRALGGGQRGPGRGQGHRLRPTPGPGSATSPPTSSGPWPRSSASSAPRCG